jgi:hypothetical protein
MLSAKIQTPEERLQTWRQLRSSDISLGDLLKKFGEIAVSSRYIDFYTPSSWPSVFEIVTDGMFCQSGITLVMAATMHYKNMLTTDQITLPVVSNHINGNTGLVLIYQDMVYNFIPGEAVHYTVLAENSTTYTEHIIQVKQLFK